MEMINIESLKGISPGKIINKELKKANLSQREFAKKLNIHSQTLNAVILGKRNLPLEMALKIEKYLSWPEGSLMILQVFHQIKLYRHEKLKNKEENYPKIREILFWDTDFKKIDWLRQQKFILKRVKERGNEEEKLEIARFYNINIESLQ